MEVLKSLSEEEISRLREVFELREEGLDVRAFEKVLTDACANKPSINVAQLRLRELFSEIDSSGDGFVNWEEFTMFIIHRTDGRNKAATGTGLDGMIKNYLLNTVIEHQDIPKSVVDMRFVPRLNKIVKVVKQEHGFHRIRVCQNDFRITPHFEIPRPPSTDVSMVSFEYIPSCTAQNSNCLAVSYSDSYMRLVDMQKRRLTMNNEVRVLKTFRLAESQTVLRWSSKYQRLVMGSRTGILSVLHPDEQNVYNQEKLHNLLVSDMVVDDSLLFTASVDPVDSVKCVDLQRSVVRYALNDHTQGTTLIEVNPQFQTLFSVGFELYIVSHAMLMPRVKAWRLFDSTRPHRGRITHLKLVPNTPQLLSSDSCGLTKLWDIRMNQCVQNILPPKDELDITPPEQSAASSICVIGPSKRIIINGRNTAIYCYEGAQDPSVADDVAAHLILINNSTQMIATFHQKSIKHWDIATGELTATYKNIIPNCTEDISAASIVMPMERKMLIGTVGGRIARISFALCEFENELSRFCVDFRGEEVTNIISVPNLRESNPYIVASFRRDVLVIPDVEGHSMKSAVTLKALTDAMHPHAVVKSMQLVRGTQLFVGCSDGAIRLVDLVTFAVTSEFEARSVMRGDVIALCTQTMPNSSHAVYTFVASGVGNVTCAAMPTQSNWEIVANWDGTEHCEVKTEIETSQSQSVSPPLPTLEINSDGTHGDPFTKKAVSPTSASISSCPSRCSLMDDSARHATARMSTATLKRNNSAVDLYLNPSSKAERALLLGSCVVCMQYVHDEQALVTADERGVVTVWDVSQLAAHSLQYVADPVAAASRPSRSQPTLISWWKAHSEEIIAMTVHAHRNTQRHVIITSSNDKRVCLWSMCGVLLGNLALGRDDSVSVLAEGVLPLLINQPNAVEHWASYDAYKAASAEKTMRNAKSVGDARRSTSSNRHTPTVPTLTSSPSGAPLPLTITGAEATHSEFPIDTAGATDASHSMAFLTQLSVSVSVAGGQDGPQAPSRGSLMDDEFERPRVSRLTGLVKNTATMSSSRWKREPMPTHLTAHTGALQLPATPSGRIHPAPPPSPGRGGASPRTVLPEISHASPLASPSPRKSIVACGQPSPRPPLESPSKPLFKPQLKMDVSPPRLTESAQSKKVLQWCKKQLEPVSARDALERHGRVTLRSPDIAAPSPPPRSSAVSTHPPDASVTSVPKTPMTRFVAPPTTRDRSPPLQEREPSHRALKFYRADTVTPSPTFDHVH